MSEAADQKHDGADDYERIGRPEEPLSLSADEIEFSRCSPWLQDKLDQISSPLTLADLWDGIISGRTRFWSSPESAAITTITQYAKLKAIEAVLVAGSEQEFMGTIEPAIREYGAMIGCDVISILGNSDWATNGERFGYRLQVAVMVRALKN